jgi:glucose-1-phosphate adenylyltransferase
MEVVVLQQVDATVLGLSPNEARRKPFIASMGIYVFKKRVLLKLLRSVMDYFVIDFSRVAC